MTVRGGQSVTKEFTTRSFSTGARVNADSTPTGTLVVNGTDDAATVTVTNITTGRYKAAVTLPTLAIGDVVELVITATVGGVTDSAVVWSDSKDVLLDGGGKTTDAVQTGDAFARVGDAGAGLTALGDARIAHLDADVSSRSTYAGTDTAGTTTLLARVAGTVPLAADYTAARAAKLDNLDAAVSSRLAGSGYTAPLDAAGVRGAVGLASANLDTQLGAIAGYVDTEVAAIKAKTDNLPADPAGLAALASAHGAGSWATATGFAVPGDPMGVTTTSGNALVAATAAQVTADHGAGSYARNTEPLDAAGVRAALGLSAANLDLQLGAIDDYLDTEIVAIKGKTDQLTFTTPNKVDATAAVTGVDVDEAAIAAAVVAQLGGASITVQSPVLPSGEIELVQGDSYTAALNRALQWSLSGPSVPDLTGAAITLEVGNGILIVTGDAPTPAGSTKVVRAQPRSADTQVLGGGSYTFKVVATFSGQPADRVTLLEGKAEVKGRDDS